MRRVLTPLSQDQSLNQMRSKHFTPMLGAPIRPDNGSHTALRNEHRLLAPTAPVRLNSLLA
ncbi:hypothetical protein PFWH6_5404 [Pseudomonas fluorescens WH6]|nr:hypothetical protein PFWH6_5404 [Pseudomonas fluorescens WH6]